MHSLTHPFASLCMHPQIETPWIGLAATQHDSQLPPDLPFSCTCSPGLCACPPAQLPACLPACLPARPLAHPPACLPACLPAYLLRCLTSHNPLTRRIACLPGLAATPPEPASTSEEHSTVRTPLGRTLTLHGTHMEVGQPSALQVTPDHSSHGLLRSHPVAGLMASESRMANMAVTGGAGRGTGRRDGGGGQGRGGEERERVRQRGTKRACARALTRAQVGCLPAGTEEESRATKRLGETKRTEWTDALLMRNRCGTYPPHSGVRQPQARIPTAQPTRLRSHIATTPLSFLSALPRALEGLATRRVLTAMATEQRRRPCPRAKSPSSLVPPREPPPALVEPLHALLRGPSPFPLSPS